MLKRKRYNLNAHELMHKKLKRAELFQQKEKVFISDEWSGYCDNTDHPLFSIKVTKQKPFAACYYCSKVWMLTNDKED
jgi:uncharacterized Zn-finger protein